MRVLIVHEAKAMRQAIRTAIEGLKDVTSEFLEADNGFQAVLLMKSDSLKIDLILADWNMPRMDAISFLKKVRVLSPLRDIPVIIVTDESHTDQMPMAVEWGASDHIVTPFTDTNLQNKIVAIRRDRNTRIVKGSTNILRTIAGAAPSDENQSFLAHLPTEIAEGFHQAAEIRTFKAGDTLIQEAQYVEFFYFIRKGDVELVDGSGKTEIRGPGETFGEREFMGGEAATCTVHAMTAIEVGCIAEAAMAELVQKHPSLSFHLSNLLARRRSSAPVKPEGPAATVGIGLDNALSGNLDAVPISDLIQVLWMTNKTGVLNLSLMGKVGGVYYVDGEVQHAWLEDLEGNSAIYAILQAKKGAFIFDTGRTTESRTLTEGTMTLLIEGMRQKDEASRGADTTSRRRGETGSRRKEKTDGESTQHKLQTS